MACTKDRLLVEWLPMLREHHHTPPRLRILADPLALPMRQLAGHQHPVPTLILPLRGNASITWRGGQVAIGPNQTILLAPCTRHRHEPLRPGCVVFHLGFKGTLCDIAVQQGEWRSEAHIAGRQMRVLVDALLALEEVAQRKVLAQILHRVVNARRLPLPPQHPAVSRMTHHLWWHYDEPIDAATVLTTSGLGRSRAAELFAQYYGHGPAKELQRLRLESARYLLAGGLGVAATAQRCGYRDRRSFTRSYKRYYGRQPSDDLGQAGSD